LSGGDDGGGTPATFGCRRLGGAGDRWWFGGKIGQRGGGQRSGQGRKATGDGRGGAWGGGDRSRAQRITRSVIVYALFVSASAFELLKKLDNG
jgi:hypothetical protein